MVHDLADDFEAVLRCEPLLPGLHEGLSATVQLLVDLGNLWVICGSSLGRAVTPHFFFMLPESDTSLQILLITL